MGRDYVDLRFESKHLAGADEMRVLRVLCSEQLSQPYRVELDLAIPEASEIGLGELSGAEGTVVLDRPGGPTRRMHGVIAEATELPPVSGWHTFRLVLRPRLWLATLVEAFDVHLDQTVPQIVEARVRDAEIPLAMRLAEEYPPRDIVTQYRETDLAFISRRCEHLGIFYFFEHGEDEETVVFGDSPSAYGHVAEDDVVPFVGRGDLVGVTEIVERRELVPATYVCRDYDYRAPQLELHGEHKLDQGFAGGIFEYGSHFRTEGHGKLLARVRAEEQLSRHQTFHGQGADVRFAAGHTFTLGDHPHHGRRLVVVSVEHEARQPLFEDATDGGRDYQNRFVAVPVETTWRPPRRTPVPRIHGLVTAVVEIGPGEVETYAKIDEQGRYTVCFLFDASGPDRERASAPVRMLQPHAGPGYGMHFPLKPGVEVLVAFVDGNVDRPVIVGAVPNPITATPVAVAESTKSRIQTRSGIVIEFDDKNRRA
jgi:type VI secretion system secreted protein VgrG